ncbi:hypothetical protein [Vogesella indigofera]|uniref:hypothetical protein n=1 Tax=Vogesella indigofera TaxID=45465 RepID=UPI003F421774
MSFFLQRWLGGGGPWGRQEVSQAVERLIDEVDPKVRLLPRSQQQLQRGVRDTLRYASELIEHLPAPLDLSPAGYTTDRRVGLLFASPESLCRVLQGSEALQQYFSHPSNPDTAYLLLVMQPQARQRLGSQLLPDGQVQNDVPQQVISFEQHRVVAAYDSLKNLRQLAGMEAFNALCRDLARRVALFDARRQQLEAERQRVLLRLSAGGQTLINADALRGRDDVKDDELPQRLQQLDAELAVMGKQLSLPGKLDYLRQVLRQPQQYFKAGLESTWLDRMGVVTPPDLGGAQLDFGLMKLGEAEDSVRERVVFPGSITRRDLLQWRERWPQ